uniref:Agamous-like MADS-box protein AGL61 n=2 Tax=Cajanus cajan TaxID=3821 RepID=A0A151U7H3_CAJCA|nr:Agamous-like MADS-box protein AGL61 [Cajanus cajan]
MQLTQLFNHLEMEKKRGEDLDHVRKARQRQFWWETPVDDLGLHHLLQLKLSIEDLKNNIQNHATNFILDHSSSLLGPNNALPPIGRSAASSLHVHPNAHYLAFPTAYL